MATIYRAREREATTIPIVDILRDGEIDIYLNVQSRDYFDITFRGDRLTVTAGKYVGLIPLNERVFVDVEPKMPVLNLARILSAARGDVVPLDVLERQYETARVRPAAILEAMADAFAVALRTVETKGIEKEYRRNVLEAPALKGQIRFGPSVQGHWSRGRRHLAECEFSDLTADTADNRLLRYACHYLLTHHRLTGTPTRSVRPLSDFEEFLDAAGVALVRPISLDEPATSAGGSPDHVRATKLARAIVADRGVELPGRGGELSLPSFLINMESVFEQYTRHVIAARLTGFKVQDGNKEGKKPLFDDRRNPLATPDIVVRDVRGVAALVGEVKYKADESRDDLNQVLGYALAYQVDRVLMILPADAEHLPGLALLGRVANVSVYRYRIDLADGDLDAQEAGLAGAVEALVPEAAA